jgi:hypothetical protein
MSAKLFPKYARPHPVIGIVTQSHIYNVAKQLQLHTTSLKSNKWKQEAVF